MDKNIDGVVLQINKQAMDLLQEDSLKSSLKLLLSATKLLKKSYIPKSSGLWGLTFNNLGCVYRKADNKKGALHYFSKALEMEIQNSHDATNVASTHLNISAILSSMGDHETSLAHSLASLKTLQATNSKGPNFCISIALAYHSIGIENEFLKRAKDAVTAFKKGWEIAEKELGPTHRLTETLHRSYAKSCNIPTMPVLGTMKKKKKMKKKLTTGGLLPVISTATSRLSSFTREIAPIAKAKSINRSSCEPNMRYTIRTRHSVSPLNSFSKGNYLSEIESINKLIKELDGQPQPMKTHKNYLKSIILIQKHWRGYLARKAVLQLKRKQKIKNMANAHRKILPIAHKKPLPQKLLKPIPETRVENKHDAAICIQSLFRMWPHRKKFKKLRASAITIQKHVKRRITRKLYLLILDAVIFIQAVFRGFQIRKRLYRVDS